jgi:hypothetical protein
VVRLEDADITTLVDAGVTVPPPMRVRPTLAGRSPDSGEEGKPVRCHRDAPAEGDAVMGAVIGGFLPVAAAVAISSVPILRKKAGGLV